MTDSQYALIGIPYQRVVLDLVVEVEHPLSVPCEFIQGEVNHNGILAKCSNSYIESSMLRLLNIANRLSQSPDRLVKRINIPTTIIRDLLSGSYWPERELNVELYDSNVYSNVKVEPRIQNQSLDYEKLSEIVEPVKSFLAKKTGLARDNVVNHVRLENCTVQETEYIATKVRLISATNGRKMWIYDSGPFGELVSENIDTIPGFEPILPQRDEVVIEYPYSPEVQALIKLRNTRGSKNKIELGKEICKNLPRQIKEDENSRLESIHTIVGSSNDMWGYALQVLKSSESASLIISSFTNQYTFDHVVEQIQEAKADSNLERLYISIGEPDRIESIEYIEKTSNYLKELTEKLSSELTIISGVSQVPNHVKIVISDTGQTLITSSNLLSSSPNNFVLESGAIIEDAELARKLIETIIEESWIPTVMIPEVSKMEQTLLQQEYPKLDTTILEEKLAKTLQSLNSEGSKKKQFALVALENQLQKIAERPRYEIILNENHRSVLVDSASRFYERLVLASDGLRESGLDKATINLIIKRSNYVNKKHGNNPIIQIWWGRHAPGSKSIDDEDLKEREHAKERLSLFRGSKGKFQFYPSHSNKPMETHAKLIIIDDARLFLTSDNFMAFGDPESYQGDAGELGLLIDHPRIARQIRGQMELWLPKAREDDDLTRWGAAIADEIYVQTYSPHTAIPFENAIKELFLRILEIPILKDDWNQQFTNINHHEVIQKIVDTSWNNGGTIGLFHASGSGAGQYKSISVEQTLVSLSGDPIWRELNDEEATFSNVMKKHLEETNQKKVNSYSLTPEEFSQALISEMRNPYEWHELSSVYDIIIQKNYLYNLKLRGEKPVKYLEKCTDFIEIDIREGGHPWIRKRRE